MKYNCKVIQDLLPLYTDGICSDVSAQMVEEHLKECASCEKIAKELQDDSVEKTLGKECDHVVLSHEKKVSKKMVTAGSITAAVLLIPVIVCLICNLAIGHALDWFFIVLTALLVVASVTLVPMLVVEKKAVYTVLAFTGTLVLLLFTCCFYTHGNWFFVAAAAVVFGLSVCFAPVVIHGLLSDGRWKRKRAWIVVAWDSLWLYLLLAVCGWFVHGNVTYWRVALGISTYSILLVWGWTAVLCSRNCNRWNKAGLLVMLTGVWTGFVTDVVNFLLRDTENGLRYLDLAKGFPLDDPAVFNANMYFMMIAVSVFVGVICLCIGHGRGKSEKTD